jgi:hypothetical protein
MLPSPSTVRQANFFWKNFCAIIDASVNWLVGEAARRSTFAMANPSCGGRGARTQAAGHTQPD